MKRVVSTLRRWLWHVNPLRATPEAVFTRIYQANAWGDTESTSGTGSNLEQTRALRAALPALLRDLQVRTLLDIPCGDFYWMSQLELGLDEYIGGDIVEGLISANQRKYGSRGEARISFRKMDLLTDELPRTDLVLCRDCLVHFSFAHITQALVNISRSGARYLLTTNFSDRATQWDIATGDWRPINLLLPPFSFPAPVLSVRESCTEAGGRFADKSLSLWEIARLPLMQPAQRQSA